MIYKESPHESFDVQIQMKFVNIGTLTSWSRVTNHWDPILNVLINFTIEDESFSMTNFVLNLIYFTVNFFRYNLHKSSHIMKISGLGLSLRRRGMRNFKTNRRGNSTCFSSSRSRGNMLSTRSEGIMWVEETRMRVLANEEEKKHK